MPFRSLAAVIALIALSACGNTADIGYAPTTAVVPLNSPAVSAVSVRDVRDEKPNRYATVRGGYGNPINVLDSSRPVADEVADVFTKALQARGMLGGPNAPYRVVVTLRTFYANQYLDENAYVDMDMTVLSGDGRTIYSDTVKDKEARFQNLGGVFGSINSLGKMAETLLDKSVDRMVDNPGFRAAIGRGGARS